MTDQQPPQPQVITDGQAALIEAAQVRIAVKRLRLVDRREAGKLQRPMA